MPVLCTQNGSGRQGEQFWDNLIKKYEKKNDLLRKQEYTLRQRCKANKNCASSAGSNCAYKKLTSNTSILPSSEISSSSFIKESFDSADIEYIQKIHELDENEKELKRQLNELHEPTTFLGDENKKCTSDLEEINSKLKRENQKLQKQLEQIKCGIPQRVRQTTECTANKFENEQCKTKKIRENLNTTAKSFKSKQKTYSEEMNTLKSEITGTFQSMLDIDKINTKLREELCMLKSKCSAVQKDLVNQKITEAHTFSQLDQTLRERKKAYEKIRTESDLCLLTTKLANTLNEMEYATDEDENKVNLKEKKCKCIDCRCKGKGKGPCGDVNEEGRTCEDVNPCDDEKFHLEEEPSEEMEDEEEEEEQDYNEEEVQEEMPAEHVGEENIDAGGLQGIVDDTIEDIPQTIEVVEGIELIEITGGPLAVEDIGMLLEGQIELVEELDPGIEVDVIQEIEMEETEEKEQEEELIESEEIENDNAVIEEPQVEEGMAEEIEMEEVMAEKIEMEEFTAEEPEVEIETEKPVTEETGAKIKEILSKSMETEVLQIAPEGFGRDKEGLETEDVEEKYEVEETEIEREELVTEILEEKYKEPISEIESELVESEEGELSTTTELKKVVSGLSPVEEVTETTEPGCDGSYALEAEKEIKVEEDAGKFISCTAEETEQFVSEFTKEEEKAHPSDCECVDCICASIIRDFDKKAVLQQEEEGLLKIQNDGTFGEVLYYEEPFEQEQKIEQVCDQESDEKEEYKELYIEPSVPHHGELFYEEAALSPIHQEYLGLSETVYVKKERREKKERKRMPCTYDVEESSLDSFGAESSSESQLVPTQVHITEEPQIEIQLMPSQKSEVYLPLDALNGEGVEICADTSRQEAIDIETEVGASLKGCEARNVTTAITGSGTLEVLTKGPGEIIETTMMYTESGNIEITTEITEYECSTKEKSIAAAQEIELYADSKDIIYQTEKPYVDTEMLKINVAEALNKVNEKIVEALFKADENLTEALENVDQDVEDALTRTSSASGFPEGTEYFAVQAQSDEQIAKGTKKTVEVEMEKVKEVETVEVQIKNFEGEMHKLLIEETENEIEVIQREMENISIQISSRACSEFFNKIIDEKIMNILKEDDECTQMPDCSCKICVTLSSVIQQAKEAHPFGCTCVDCLFNEEIEIDKKEEHPLGCDCIACICGPDQGSISAIDIGMKSHPPDCTCLQCICNPEFIMGGTQAEIEQESSKHLDDCNCLDCIITNGLGCESVDEIPEEAKVSEEDVPEGKEEFGIIEEDDKNTSSEGEDHISRSDITSEQDHKETKILCVHRPGCDCLQCLCDEIGEKECKRQLTEKGITDSNYCTRRPGCTCVECVCKLEDRKEFETLISSPHSTNCTCPTCLCEPSTLEEEAIEAINGSQRDVTSTHTSSAVAVISSPQEDYPQQGSQGEGAQVIREEKISADGMEVTSMRRIFPNSLLIKWTECRFQEVTGYEVDVNGSMKYRIRSRHRTVALLPSLEFSSDLSLAIYAIGFDGSRLEPPASAVFQQSN